MSTRLDFSIGPVQGFVSQSRRTRDLWGSSYLLAFLSAHAMHGAEQAGGRIVQPIVRDDPLYRWASGDRSGEAPRFGTLPNHFVAAVDGDARRVALAAIESLYSAWKRVHEVVWMGFVAHAAPTGDDTEAIWNRQVESFWEVMWAEEDRGASSDGSQAVIGAFARRKTWRSQHPSEEPGDKCTLMHDLQELSGHVRAHHRNRQDRFWQAVRSRVGALDFRDNERLCAIALVKRLLPRVAADAMGWEVDASRWPSTAYIGAVPWLRQVVCAAPQQAAKYADVVSRAARDVRTMPTSPFCLAAPAAGDFVRLDANYVHRAFVANESLCPLDRGDANTREDLLKRLKTLYEVRRHGKAIGPPPTFYAMILADGDRLGQLLGKLGGEVVSKSLRAFTGEVPTITQQHHGVTVYAGGDDVLLMLPVPSALACAQDLSTRYKAAFEETDAKGEATLSAAVVFAHIRSPLNQVLDEAHRLLDDVAKDGNGRDSLAVTVLKPGGPYCQWVTTWTRPGKDGPVRATDQLSDLLGQFNAEAEDAEAGLSSSLVYRTRDTLARLCGWERWQPGSWSEVPEDIDVRALLCADIAHSLDVRTPGDTEVRAAGLTESVWNLLMPARNHQGTISVANADDQGAVVQAGVDALLLARFLVDPDSQDSDR